MKNEARGGMLDRPIIHMIYIENGLGFTVNDIETKVANTTSHMVKRYWHCRIQANVVDGNR